MGAARDGGAARDADDKARRKLMQARGVLAEQQSGTDGGLASLMIARQGNGSRRSRPPSTARVEECPQVAAALN